mmetsp:Transcript_16254/g.44135  ORF Transcript_16254/g.44135 Transcript_16254/m.44135 type:complete len:178 (-) Transcript_16254:55-588(-)
MGLLVHRHRGHNATRVQQTVEGQQCTVADPLPARSGPSEAWAHLSRRGSGRAWGCVKAASSEAAPRRGPPQRAQGEGPAVGHKITAHRLPARALESAVYAAPFQEDHAGKLHRSGLVSAVDTMKLAELGELRYRPALRRTRLARIPRDVLMHMVISRGTTARTRRCRLWVCNAWQLQ